MQPRFDDITDATLAGAGWFPGRSVSIDSWVELLRAEGVEMHGAAAEFLVEFGGLESANEGPGITRAREPFTFDPGECVGEGDRFLEWSQDLGRQIFPIGILDHGRFFLGLDENSELYCVEDWVATFGRMPVGMIHLVRGVMPAVLG
ncbi:SUKH-3 domain-containing protein [Promicromonospora kroppenstedtii]|uniref:SUKH-3 domain-containing protein n=1 Tax=Promicromonospora kroppenstedtii TaxID=440482 RepID=UPI0009FF2212|nr:SUKH-3 domain-containing protein [Promicromonospora kroppenstedtii]